MCLLALGCAVGHATSTFGQSSDRLSRGIDEYRHGNYSVAVELLKPLAEAGNADAQYTLSQSYALLNWNKHVEEVLHWSRAAAEQGHRDAQYQQGYFYQKGLGVQENERLAAGWYEMAAKQCHTQAKFELGKMYRNGYGVSRDLVEAFAWLNAASLVPGVDENIRRERDEVERELTPSELERARRLSWELYEQYAK